jgi:hypothetical protein
MAGDCRDPGEIRRRVEVVPSIARRCATAVLTGRRPSSWSPAVVDPSEQVAALPALQRERVGVVVDAVIDLLPRRDGPPRKGSSGRGTAGSCRRQCVSVGRPSMLAPYTRASSRASTGFRSNREMSTSYGSSVWSNTARSNHRPRVMRSNDHPGPRPGHFHTGRLRSPGDRAGVFHQLTPPPPGPGCRVNQAATVCKVRVCGRDGGQGRGIQCRTSAPWRLRWRLRRCRRAPRRPPSRRRAVPGVSLGWRSDRIPSGSELSGIAR